MSPKPPEDAPASSDSATTPEADAAPSTPRKPNVITVTAGGRRVSGARATPKSAPAAGARRRSASKKQPEHPTLLADFLMGRPSPHRVAADKQRARRQSLEAVKLEMRQSSVRRLQQPGGVKDRVKQWQKKNASAMVAGDPAATPSEPTDFVSDVESVTEEDRVRIKLRQRKKQAPKVIVHNDDKPPKPDSKSNGDDAGEAVSRDSSREPKDPDQSPSKGPPKRVVSDTNWMAKRNRKSPPRSKSPPNKANRVKKNSTTTTTGQPLPKDFLLRPAVNPPVSKKVQDWASKVELPESPPPSRYSRSKSRDANGNRVKSVGALYEGLETSSKQSSSSRGLGDDGIRVTPMRRRKLDDDGIRVRGSQSKSPLPDDGIRVRPLRSTPASRERTPRAAKEPVAKEEDEIIVTVESDSDQIEVLEDSDSVLNTPTRRPSREKPRRVSRKRSPPRTRAENASDDRSWISTDDSALRTGLSGSDLSSSVLTSAVGAKSLADIPVGFSAFSDLDLPAGGKGGSRPKTQRNPSFKGMGVFKKVVAEGKKILSEASEPPPKPAAANKPPSIENWLSGTVDPFVEKTDVSESPAPRKNSFEQQWADQARRRTSASNRRRKSSPPPRTELTEVTDVTESTGLTQTTATTDWTESTDNDENRAPSHDDETVTESERTPTPISLKRRSATRATSSPLKPGAKKPFKEVLKEAFRGESGAHVFLPKRYSSYEKRPPSPEYDDDYYDDDYTGLAPKTQLSGSSDSWTDLSSSSLSDDRYAPTAGPRRRPPTNGVHELSTIVGSTDELSSLDSDLSSHVSDTTVTQSTGLTKDTEVSRQRSNGSGTGLKRRLTKHSDLVSVLSLPDGQHEPSRSLSRASLRRTKSKSDTVTLDDLLQEFVEDENLYQRELKTLVDGVVPVLLTTVLNGDRQSAINLFGPESPGSKANNMSKAVVNMGIALEKMKNAHRRASHTDVHKLIKWMQTVVPIYDSYLDAWRLGFQDLVVNLLPAADKLDDEDSLIGALPRNAAGDVVNEHGDRVDVAHLLKRPVLRIKLLSRWAQGVHILLSSYETLALSGDFDGLQEKARRRQREETARLADEDAFNTDTSRARDLRTLAPLAKIKIDSNKQVNAKDLFSLSLAHSSGQRLECQVELVFRDRPSVPEDKGDLLIRETGDGRRTWLLFPPAPWSAVSARRGEAEFELVIMIQGSHNGDPWYEIISLTTDNDDQIEDWLEILGTVPVPAFRSARAVDDEPTMAAPSPGTTGLEIPVGGRVRADTASSPGPASPGPDSQPTTPVKRATPSRYHSNRPGISSSPNAPSPLSPSREKTPTQESHDEARQRENDRSRPLQESMRPEPLQLKKSAPNSTPYRDDGAPPPPVHRSFKSKSPQPQPELKSPHMKRRTSSPLKREYLPSDDSSVTEGTFTSESDPESSDDEFDEGPDIPQSELGFSIKDQDLHDDDIRAAPTDSMVSESICSLTPSHSASQTGIHRQSGTPEGYTRYIATISHWFEKKGIWKEIAAEPCSVIVGPGIIEAYAFGASGVDKTEPLLALDLTPLVLLRQSTVVDLEIRSAVQDHCKNRDIKGGNFRFRCPSSTECFDLYMAVHHARLNNQKFIQLENDARFKQFGERQAPADNDGDSSSRRRSWFGRKNSYRASTRAPSQSQEGGSVAPSSSVSATSFLKRLTGGGNLSFNIARSSVDKQSMFGGGGGSGNNSIYGSSSSSSGGMNTPRAPSLYSSARMQNGQPLSSDNIRIRLHLLATATKWEDYGNCLLQIRRPPPGWHQALRANHGLEKRITVTTMPRKDTEKARIVLDAVLGSGCFQPMGNRGIMVNIWEELKGVNGEVGVAPATGGAAGSVKKWCFQCLSGSEASWVLRLVHQEVMGLMP